MQPPAGFDATGGEHFYNNVPDQRYIVHVGHQVTDLAGAPVLMYIPGTGSEAVSLDNNPFIVNLIMVIVRASPPRPSRSKANYHASTPVWVMHLALACRAGGGRKCSGMGFSRGGFWLTQMAGMENNLFESIALIGSYCQPSQSALEQQRIAGALLHTKVIAYVLLNDESCLWREYSAFFNELIGMKKTVYLRLVPTLSHEQLPPLMVDGNMSHKLLRNVEGCLYKVAIKGADLRQEMGWF